MLRREVDWSAVDWSKTNKAISTDTGWSANTVSRRRKEAGVEPHKRGRPRGCLVPWLESAQAMRDNGMSYRCIAQEIEWTDGVKVSRQRVHAVLSNDRSGANGES